MMAVACIAERPWKMLRLSAYTQGTMVPMTPQNALPTTSETSLWPSPMTNDAAM